MIDLACGPAAAVHRLMQLGGEGQRVRSGVTSLFFFFFFFFFFFLKKKTPLRRCGEILNFLIDLITENAKRTFGQVTPRRERNHERADADELHPTRVLEVDQDDVPANGDRRGHQDQLEANLVLREIRPQRLEELEAQQDQEHTTEGALTWFAGGRPPIRCP